VSPKLVFRKAERQVSPVTISPPSPESLYSTQFAAVYKRPTEGGLGAFCFSPLAFGLEGFLVFGFWGLWLYSFVLGFLVWEAFGRERIAGKLLKGKEMA
jgi:hypothetical protein